MSSKKVEEAAVEALLRGANVNNLISELSLHLANELGIESEVGKMVSSISSDIPQTVSLRSQKVARAMISSGVAQELTASFSGMGLSAIVHEVHAGLKSKEELQALLSSSFAKARTVANTSLAGIQRKVARDVAGSMIGESPQYYIYSGPEGDELVRPFCAQLVGKAVTMEGLRNGNNGQGLNPAIYLGGWNCRHTLVPTTLKRIRAQNIPIADGYMYCI